MIAAVNAIDSRNAQAGAAKRQLALEFVHCWLNPSFYHAKKSGREIIMHFRLTPNAEQQMAYLREEAPREANLADVLNLFEALAITLEMGLLEEDICKRFFKTIVAGYWHAVEPYIRKRRAERENPRLYQEMEWLARRWSS